MINMLFICDPLENYSNIQSEFKKLFNNFKLYVKTFDIIDLYNSVISVNNFVKEFNIDLIIAHSKAALLVLPIKNVCKIVINPCLSIYNEICKTKLKLKYDSKTINSIKDCEIQIKKGLIKNDETVLGIFGDHDELYSKKYELIFRSKYNNIIEINEGHKLTYRFIQEIKKYLDRI